MCFSYFYHKKGGWDKWDPITSLDKDGSHSLEKRILFSRLVVETSESDPLTLLEPFVYNFFESVNMMLDLPGADMYAIKIKAVSSKYIQIFCLFAQC